MKLFNKQIRYDYDKAAAILCIVDEILQEF